jgi:hypothetical protein
MIKFLKEQREKHAQEAADAVTEAKATIAPDATATTQSIDSQGAGDFADNPASWVVKSECKMEKDNVKN